MKIRNCLNKLVLLLFFFFQLIYLFLIKLPVAAIAASSFTSADITLTNSRLSYRAMLGADSASNDTNFAISTSPSGPATDDQTNNLFINDRICFNNPSSNGCSGQTTYTINNVPTNTTFGVSSAVANAMTTGTDVVATQSARWTVRFTARTSVASGGFLRLTIPDTANSNADGMPDPGGFDSSSLPSDLLGGNCSGNACLSLSGFTASAGSLTTTSGTGQVILITLSSALTAGTSYSFILGHASDTTLRLRNPSPSTTTHTSGSADTNSATLQSEDSSNNILDNAIVKIANVDGVQVSATVQQTIAYTIAGVASSTSACGITTGVTTTATTIPFGSITTFDAFTDAAQTHTITTNAANGYTLTAQEDQALTRVGANNTIADTGCDGAACSAGASGGVCTPATWSTGSNHGFGYTLANISGSDASFTNSSGYCPLTTVPNQIMGNAGNVSGNSIYMCSRLSIGSSQAAGTYVNTLTFTAIPKF